MPERSNPYDDNTGNMGNDPYESPYANTGNSSSGSGNYGLEKVNPFGKKQATDHDPFASSNNENSQIIVTLYIKTQRKIFLEIVPPAGHPFFFLAKNFFFEFYRKNVEFFFNESDCKNFRIFFNEISSKQFRNFLQ